MNIFGFILSMILSPLFSAFQSGARDPVILTAEDAGKTIELKKEDTIQVSLRGNPTTGYNWFLAAQSPAVLQQEGTPIYKPDTQLMGSPGMVTLTFKAIASGQTVLHLDYKRSWQTGAAASNSFQVNVLVK